MKNKCKKIYLFSYKDRFMPYVAQSKKEAEMEKKRQKKRGLKNIEIKVGKICA